MVRKRSGSQFVRKRDVSRNTIFMVLLGALVVTFAGTMVSVNNLGMAGFGGPVITGAATLESESSFAVVEGVALAVIGGLFVLLLAVYFGRRYFRQKSSVRKVKKK